VIVELIALVYDAMGEVAVDYEEGTVAGPGPGACGAGVYAAGARRYQFRRGLVRFRSRPLSSMASSSGRIETLLSFASVSAPTGQQKRPCSILLAQTHNPLPFHTSALSLVRERFVKRNRWPLIGSCPR
jgi:hypothetical protein